jgi:hypothetical protein
MSSEHLLKRITPRGKGQTLLGGVLAVIGFFVPWWFVSGLGYFGVFGPANLYIVLLMPDRFPGIEIGYIRTEAIAPTILLAGELVMCATGVAILRGTPQSGLGRTLLRLGTFLSGLVAILGMLALVVAFAISPIFALSFPYEPALPFFGQLISLAGWIFVLRGLSAARKARRAVAGQPVTRE